MFGSFIMNSKLLSFNDINENLPPDRQALAVVFELFLEGKERVIHLCCLQKIDILVAKWNAVVQELNMQMQGETSIPHC